MEKGEETNTKWVAIMLKNGSWVEFIDDQLIKVNFLMMSNCHVSLGDSGQKQIFGIPMGFYIFTLVMYNIYFLFYQCQLIMRLAKLGRTNIMGRFKYVAKYIWMTYLGLMCGTKFIFGPIQSQDKEQPFLGIST